MSQVLIPCSIDELLREYDYYITGCIVRLCRGHVSTSDVKDLKQQVAARLLEYNYLASYDPSKGKFTTYLYWLIRSIVVKAYERRQRERRTVGIARTQEEAQQDDLVLETYRDMVDDATERRAMAYDWAEKFEHYLWAQKRVVTLGERRFKGGLAVVFRMLRQEWTTAEIARALGVTSSNVSGIVRRIRQEALTFEQQGALACA